MQDEAGKGSDRYIVRITSPTVEDDGGMFSNMLQPQDLPGGSRSMAIDGVFSALGERSTWGFSDVAGTLLGGVKGAILRQRMLQ